MKACLLIVMEPKNKSSEWLLTAGLVLVVATLFTLSKINLQRTTRVAEELVQEEVCVQVLGAVHKPGVYKVLLGAPLETAIRKARPMLHADFSKLSLKAPVLEPITVCVDAFKEIEIQVVGEGVEPAELVVLAGTRVCDLRGKVILKPEAKKTFFRSKRQLKNGEIIDVPKKTVE